MIIIYYAQVRSGAAGRGGECIEGDPQWDGKTGKIKYQVKIIIYTQ